MSAAPRRGKLTVEDYLAGEVDAKVRIQEPSSTRFYYPDAMVVCDENPDRKTPSAILFKTYRSL